MRGPRRNVVDIRRQARNGITASSSSAPAPLRPLQAYVAAGGAAPLAAWSPTVRLSSAFTSSIVRVRNATTTVQTDVSPAGNVMATADLSGLLALANGTGVTVYDQSGNAYDLTNATVAAQPKIWDLATGLVLVGGLPTTLHTGAAFAASYWSRADSLGQTGSPGLTCFAWYRHTAVVADESVFHFGGGTGASWGIGARASDGTHYVRQANTSNGRYFTPTDAITTAGYTVAKRAAASNVNAAVFRREGVAETQLATDAGTLNLVAGNTYLCSSVTAGQRGLAGNFVAAILVAEDAGAAPLAALEAFGESLDTLAGV